MSAIIDISDLLTAKAVAIFSRAQKIQLLSACGVSVICNGRHGWQVMLDRTRINCTDLDATLNQALAVLRTRRDLWPKRDAA